MSPQMTHVVKMPFLCRGIGISVAGCLQTAAEDNWKFNMIQVSPLQTPWK